MSGNWRRSLEINQKLAEENITKKGCQYNFEEKIVPTSHKFWCFLLNYKRNRITKLERKSALELLLPENIFPLRV